MGMFIWTCLFGIGSKVHFIFTFHCQNVLRIMGANINIETFSHIKKCLNIFT
jgi:hypothetical protein